MMNPEKMILLRLLDKYENSKHLFDPGASNRRVRICADKKNFPEYDYEDADIRNSYNAAANRLKNKCIVKLEWRQGRQALSAITLNLDTVPEAYRLAERPHPRDLAYKIADIIEVMLGDIKTNWILAWGDDVVTKARKTYCIPSYCKKDIAFLQGLLTAFTNYDKLRGETVTMRAFSAQCYHDTKRFEKEYRDEFIKTAEKYNSELAEICQQQTMGERDKLSFLGIYARPEMYDLSGCCVIITNEGRTDISALYPHGIAISSLLVDTIIGFDTSAIGRITFIENKTRPC